jgi:hypothetical protein
MDAPVVCLVIASRPEWRAIDHDPLVDEDALVDRDVEVAPSLTGERRNDGSAVVAGEGKRQGARVVGPQKLPRRAWARSAVSCSRLPLALDESQRRWLSEAIRDRELAHSRHRLTGG